MINKQVITTPAGELAAKIQEGLKAREAGDEAGATKARSCHGACRADRQRRHQEAAEQGRAGQESDGTVKLQEG
ncbi:MAG: hypothetical protein IPL73_06730 [Candidatus Obscuribacter sp.]|nr:hypothetical protein [Candidatus Obscuribacter sp.]